MDQRSGGYARRRPSAATESARVPASEAGSEDGSAADEASADLARIRLREVGIVAIEPDDQIAALLEPDEVVVAVRRSVWLERRQGQREAGEGLAGDLYVTSQRLIHLGRFRVDYGLCEIRDAVDAPGALRLIVGEDRGIQISVDDPRVLRVEIAALRETARAPASVASRSAQAPEDGDAGDHGGEARG